MTTVDDSTPTSTTETSGAASPSGAPTTPQQARPGTTFETLAVCGFIFGLFSIFIAVFAVGVAMRAVGEAEADRRGSEAAPAVGGEGSSTLDVSLKDFAIDPDALNVAAGSTLNLTNDGAVVHNLAVEEVASPMIDAGESGELDLSELQPGTYTMICQVPGHEAAGMTGTITIE